MTSLNTSVVYQGDQDIVGQVEREGYFVLPSFFDINTTMQAREELKQLLDQDLETADRNPTMTKPMHKENWWKKLLKKIPMPAQHLLKTIEGNKTNNKLWTSGVSISKMMHTHLFPTWFCPTFASMVDDMLGSPIIDEFMRQTVGENYRLRVDLIRRSSGVDDTVDGFQLPHEWHRDTPGEFTFGIFFDELTNGGHGGTAVIPGTHLEKLDPRWDLWLAPGGRPSRRDFLETDLKKVPSHFFQNAPKNQKVRAELETQVHELSGKPGDIYFFLNDTWHGRFPNRSGKQLMIARIGGFPTDFDFKDDIPLPGTTRNLPPLLRKHYASRQPKNTDKTTTVRRLTKSVQSKLRQEAADEKMQLMKTVRAEHSGSKAA